MVYGQHALGFGYRSGQHGLGRLMAQVLAWGQKGVGLRPWFRFNMALGSGFGVIRVSAA